MASCSLEAHLHVPGEPVTKNKTNTKKVSKKIDRYMTLDTLYFVFSCLEYLLFSPGSKGSIDDFGTMYQVWSWLLIRFM